MPGISEAQTPEAAYTTARHRFFDRAATAVALWTAAVIDAATTLEHYHISDVSELLGAAALIATLHAHDTYDEAVAARQSYLQNHN